MRARTVQVLTVVALAAGLTTAVPAVAGPPTEGIGPGPVIPGPEVPRPTQPPLAWEVELKDGWRSPSWTQRTDGVTAVVHLDCGDGLGAARPQYWVQLVAKDGRPGPAVMPPAVDCGVTHTFTWDEPAGEFYLLLNKVDVDGTVLRGKAAVRTSPRIGPS